MRILAAIFFEVNLLQSSRFGEGLRIATDNLDSKNFYAFNPEFDKCGKCAGKGTRPTNKKPEAAVEGKCLDDKSCGKK